MFDSLHNSVNVADKHWKLLEIDSFKRWKQGYDSAAKDDDRS